MRFFPFEVSIRFSLSLPPVQMTEEERSSLISKMSTADRPSSAITDGPLDDDDDEGENDEDDDDDQVRMSETETERSDVDDDSG